MYPNMYQEIPLMKPVLGIWMASNDPADFRFCKGVLTNVESMTVQCDEGAHDCICIVPDGSQEPDWYRYKEGLAYKYFQYWNQHLSRQLTALQKLLGDEIQRPSLF